MRIFGSLPECGVYRGYTICEFAYGRRLSALAGLNRIPSMTSKKEGGAKEKRRKGINYGKCQKRSGAR